MNKKKILIITSLLLSLIVALQYFRELRRHSNIGIQFSSAPAHLNRHYEQELAQKEEAIWQEIEELGLSKQNCLQLKEQYAHDYQKNIKMLYNDLASSKKISPENYALVCDILNDFGVDRNKVKITSFNYHCGAAATDNTIFIDEYKLNQFSQESKKFIIAHEIVHLIYKDNSTHYILERKLGYHTDKDHPINKLKRFNESRADMIAALKSKDYAQGTVKGLEEIRTFTGENKGVTHPDINIRIAKGKEIANRMRLSLA